MAEQALELANYEAEMEKKKIDIEMRKQRVAREIRFKAQLEEKEIDLLVEEENEGVSSVGSLLRDDLEHRPSLHPPLTKQEQTATWLINCPQDSPKVTLNCETAEFIPH